MKPFLGNDLTTDKGNYTLNGSEFLVAEPSSEAVQEFEQTSQNAETIIKQSKLALPLRIIQFVCGIISLMIAGGILKALAKPNGVSLSQGYANAKEMFWLGGICLLIWGILTVLSTNKSKTVLDNPYNKQELEDLERKAGAVYSELAVPNYAKNVDILSFSYKQHKGDIKVCEKGYHPVDFINTIFKVFVESDILYIADLGGKYAFPLDSLVGIRTVKKRVTFLNWTKGEKIDTEPYKQYKLTVDNFGLIHCKYYHILEFNHNGELWGIYFPCYELKTIEELTGLKIED